MANSVVQEATVTPTYALLKFNRTLKLSEIDNTKFVVTNEDTSTTVTSPFKTIDLEYDYNTISRELTLYWNSGKLSANTAYKITLTDLYDSASALIPDSYVEFDTESDVSQDPDIISGSNEVIPIEDHSIKSVTTSDYVITSGSSDFYLSSSDPISGDYYVENDYNNGRVTIKFSEDPQAQYINNTYFRAQRKPIQRGPVRWESVDVSVSKHSTKPWVFLDYPSLDATPVYNTVGSDYFEENYKYRIIVSKDVSS